MKHLLVRVISFNIVAPYTLRVSFDDGKSEIINFEPVLYGFYYAPLRDLRLFESVQIDPEVHTLVWSNGADFDPATLYNWSQGDGTELAARAAKWEHSPALEAVE